MGTSRTRTRAQGSFYPLAKFRQHNPNLGPSGPDFDTIVRNPFQSGYETCFDTFESNPPFPDHDFNHEIYEQFPFSVYGYHKRSNTLAYYTGLGSHNQPVSVDIGEPSGAPAYSRHTFFAESTNWEYWRTKALANLNPNTPTVDTPAFIGELRELPGTLKDTMDTLMNLKDPRFIKRTGKDHLLWNFGWKPFLSDVSSMLNHRKVISNRLAYLKRVMKGDHVGRSLGSINHQVALGQNRTLLDLSMGSARLLVKAHSRAVTEVWFTAWMNSDAAYSSAENLEKLSRDSAFGFNLGNGGLLSSAWELMPWSWLNDYYYNVGDFIAATRGGIPFRVKNMNVMARTTGFEFLEISNTSSFKVEQNNTVFSRYEKKQRAAYTYPYPMITYKPGLTSGQLANLAALVASGSGNAMRARNL